MNNQEIDYQRINDEFLNITAAKCAVFNLYDEDGKSFTTKAISGDVGVIKKAADIFGYKIVGKKWKHNLVRTEKIKSSTITRFSSLNELVDGILPKPIVILLEKAFHIGEVLVIKIIKNNIMLGDFTLMMEKGKKFDQDAIAQLFTRQLGMAIIHKRAEEVLHQEKVFAEAIFDSIPGFLYVYSESGQLVKWNKKHEEMTGYSAEELSHMTLDKWFEGEDAIRVSSAVADVFRTGYGEVEADLLVKGGRKRPIRSNGVRLTMGGKIFFTGIGIDISEQKKMEAEIIEAKEYFEMMFNTNPDSSIITRLSDMQIIDVNEGFTKLFGFTRDEVIGKGSIGLYLYEDLADRSKILEELIAKGYCSNAEVSFRQKDGNVFTGLLSAKVISLNGVAHVFSNIRDITQRKQAEEALAKSEKKYMSYIENCPEVVFIADENGQYIETNNAASQITGYSKDELLQMSIRDITAEESLDAAMNHFSTLLKNGSMSGVLQYRHKDGSRRWWTIDAVKLTENRFLGFSRDITDRKKAAEDLFHLSYHDYLTGLYNRRFYDDEIKRLDMESRLPLSIIIADINGLKLINDALGHLEGDRLIVETARILQSCCRKDDILARTGGDEFCILLPKTDSKTTLEILRKIQIVCNLHNSNIANEILHINISLGCGTKEALEEDFRQVIKTAEDYMHQRKLLEHKSSHSTIIASFKATMLEKSLETEEHAERLVSLSNMVGTALNLSQIELDKLELLATLHDIGKVGIDDGILNKPGKLNEKEWDQMKKHPMIGYRIAMSSPELVLIAECILSHHEQWDGMGYPQNLAGSDIPLLSRILAIVDAYDAMTQDRPYRKAMTMETAIEELKKNAGTQFDPTITSIFIEEVMGEMK